METAIKAAAAGVAAVLAALLIKKHNPEMSVAVYLAACAVILLVALGAGKTLVQVVERARKLSGLPGAVLLPVMKCGASASSPGWGRMSAGTRAAPRWQTAWSWREPSRRFSPPCPSSARC